MFGIADSRTSIEVVADTKDLCGESPLWVVPEQAIYWTDIVGQRVYRLDNKTGKSTLLHSGFEISGLVVHAEGGFIAVNSQGLWHWDGSAGFRQKFSAVDGQPCQLNDCIADKRGRVLSGSQFFDPVKPYARGKLFLFDTNGSARILDEGFELSNGLAWSPNGEQLYLTDTVARRIYEYKYNEATGSVSDRRILIQVGLEDGIPDGLTVDAAGYLWSAQWYGGRVVRYDPEGKEERRISVPAKQTSSLAFGGADFTDLFVTTAGRHELGPFPKNYDPTGYLGGALYRVRCTIRGLAENYARIHHPRP